LRRSAGQFEYARNHVSIRINLAQFPDKHALLEQLFAEPERHGFDERCKPARRESKVGFQQPLELEERLVVKHDVVDIAQPGAGRFQAIVNRLMQKLSSNFLREKRSSWAAATTSPSLTRAAALSW
jgi:hypothetical protein